MELLKEFVALFGAMVGIPALITMIMNLLKYLDAFKKHDGKARRVSQLLNTAVFLGLFGLKTFSPETDLGPIDEVASAIAQVGIGIIGLIPLGILVSEKTHGAVRGLPLIGKSYDPEA